MGILYNKDCVNSQKIFLNCAINLILVMRITKKLFEALNLSVKIFLKGEYWLILLSNPVIKSGKIVLPECGGLGKL